MIYIVINIVLCFHLLGKNILVMSSSILLLTSLILSKIEGPKRVSIEVAEIILYLRFGSKSLGFTNSSLK